MGRRRRGGEKRRRRRGGGGEEEEEGERGRGGVSTAEVPWTRSEPGSRSCGESDDISLSCTLCFLLMLAC